MCRLDCSAFVLFLLKLCAANFIHFTISNCHKQQSYVATALEHCVDAKEEFVPAPNGFVASLLWPPFLVVALALLKRKCYLLQEIELY